MTSPPTVHTVRIPCCGCCCGVDNDGIICAVAPVQSRWAMMTPSVHSAAPRMVRGRLKPSCCSRRARQYGKQIPRVKRCSDWHARALRPSCAPQTGTSHTATSAAVQVAASVHGGGRLPPRATTDGRCCGHRTDCTWSRVRSHVSSCASAARLKSTGSTYASPERATAAHRIWTPAAAPPSTHVQPKSPTPPSAACTPVGSHARAMPTRASTANGQACGAYVLTRGSSRTYTTLRPSVRANCPCVRRTSRVVLAPNSARAARSSQSAT